LFHPFSLLHDSSLLAYIEYPLYQRCLRHAFRI